MVDTPFIRNVDRREFLNGEWTMRGANQANAAAEIASILVQARPERLDEAACAIEALPGAQIYSGDEQE